MDVVFYRSLDEASFRVERKKNSLAMHNKQIRNDHHVQLIECVESVR